MQILETSRNINFGYPIARFRTTCAQQPGQWLRPFVESWLRRHGGRRCPGRRCREVPTPPHRAGLYAAFPMLYRKLPIITNHPKFRSAAFGQMFEALGFQNVYKYLPGNKMGVSKAIQRPTFLRPDATSMWKLANITQGWALPVSL